jgi:aminoglycoside phosphotransferase (APT) family kinase protein
MKTCNDAYETAVLEVVARELRTEHLLLRPIPTYPDSVVYEAASDDRALIFKGVDPLGEDADRIGVEAWALETARAEGVPAPAVLRVDVSRDVYPGSYFLMEKVEGVPLDSIPPSSDGFERAVLELGEALRRLHDVTLSGHGRLSETAYSESGEARGSRGSWADSILAPLAQAIDYLSSSALTSEQTALLMTQVEASSSSIATDVVPVLLHGDYGSSHAFVDPSTASVTGIVDFGECASGHWIWDLCEWDLASVGLLLRGYGVESSLVNDVRHELDRYLLLKAVPWAAKWHRRGEAQVLDWLQFVISRLAG